MTVSLVAAFVVLALNCTLAAWACLRLAKSFKNRVKAGTAPEIVDSLFYDLQLSMRVYSGGIVYLACILLLKGALLLTGDFKDGWLSWAAYGTADPGGLLEVFGFTGGVIVCITVYSWWRHIKVGHYCEAIFSFREMLGVEDKFSGNWE